VPITWVQEALVKHGAYLGPRIAGSRQ
jgi:hypothetical protein